MKVVVNRCFGGFGLSMAAIRRLGELKGFTPYFYVTSKYMHRDGISEYKRLEPGDEKGICVHAIKEDLGPTCGDEAINNATFVEERDIERNDPDLVRVVEELGEAANGDFADLQITEIPDDVEWEIDEYDGNEHVAEVHRRW